MSSDTRDTRDTRDLTRDNPSAVTRDTRGTPFRGARVPYRVSVPGCVIPGSYPGLRSSEHGSSRPALAPADRKSLLPPLEVADGFSHSDWRFLHLHSGNAVFVGKCHRLSSRPYANPWATFATLRPFLASPIRCQEAS